MSIKLDLGVLLEKKQTHCKIGINFVSRAYSIYILWTTKNGMEHMQIKKWNRSQGHNYECPTHYKLKA